jgi:hypothetical protein
VIPYLGKPDLHWKVGYSAQELAIAWANAANDFPASVRHTLATAPEYADAVLIDGFFEREVELGDGRRNSQTDLMVVAGLSNEIGIIAVEGKVEESFDERVQDWNVTAGKQNRLAHLCNTLGLDSAAVGALRYQLFHRTASALYEAKRYRSHHALMLVHSFSRTHRWFEDFADFSRALGIPVERPGVCSSPKVCDGVSLRLAWVADSVSKP